MLILSEFTTNNYTVKNSYELCKDISAWKLPSKCYMCSYDIKSLFTNLPLNETIDICTNLAFKQLNHFLGMNRKVFKDTLSLCVKDCIFLFNQELYKQTDGVAMGSPKDDRVRGYTIPL